MSRTGAPIIGVWKGRPMAQRLTTPVEDSSADDGVTIKYITRVEGARLLDQRAREYLGMSGKEFKRRYREGTIEDPERSEVLLVSLLIPMSED